MTRPRILFLNHSEIHCGVYQYGKRVADIIKADPEIEYVYKELNNQEDYNRILEETPGIRAIIYNYHSSTMPWLNSSSIQTSTMNIGIPHESHSVIFDIVCDIDPTSSSPYRLPRPLFESFGSNIDESESSIKSFILEYTDSNIPIFGSFGFGFSNKGFDKIINFVNEQYDRAIIKIVMTVAKFHPDPNISYTTASHCRSIPLKPDIKLMITHQFFNDNELLVFLKSNTMNIFLYDTMPGRGISSTIDYALSVKKPIGISDSYMFRNIYSDNICLYKRPIAECMVASPAHLTAFSEEYSNDNMIKAFRSIIYKNILCA